MLIVQRRFSKVMVSDSEISPTLEAGAGGGGNNLPMIVDTYTCREFGRYEKSEITSCLRVKEPYGGGEALIIEKANEDINGACINSAECRKN